jgi:hypothetical protein
VKTTHLLFASLVLCCLFSVPVHADTITMLSVSGSGGRPVVGGSAFSPAETQYVGLSFVLGGSFRDVSISIPDLAFAYWAATGWLTNAVGPAATSGNVIATTTVDPFPAATGQATTIFLSDLSLSPGTYFFFLSSPYCSLPADLNSYGCGWGSWESPKDPTIVAASGVALFGSEIVGGAGVPCQDPNTPFCANADFPPASPWNFYAFGSDSSFGFPVIDITGTPVPEPSSLMVFGTGLLTLCGLRLRKTLSAHS